MSGEKGKETLQTNIKNWSLGNKKYISLCINTIAVEVRHVLVWKNKVVET